MNLITFIFCGLIMAHSMTGIATHYGFGWSGKRFGGSGIMVHADDPIAAHKTLPYGTIVRVINDDRRSDRYGEGTAVVIFDRGPYADGRVIDMMPHSLWDLAGKKVGGLKVRLEVIDVRYQCPDYYCLRKKLKVRRITDEVLLKMLMGELEVADGG